MQANYTETLQNIMYNIVNNSDKKDAKITKIRADIENDIKETNYKTIGTINMVASLIYKNIGNKCQSVLRAQTQTWCERRERADKSEHVRPGPANIHLLP